jgi:hypothetical protein
MDMVSIARLDDTRRRFYNDLKNSIKTSYFPGGRKGDTDRDPASNVGYKVQTDATADTGTGGEHLAVAPRRLRADPSPAHRNSTGARRSPQRRNRFRQRNGVTESGTDRGVGGRGRRRGGASETAAGGVVASSAKEQQRGGVREEERGRAARDAERHMSAGVSGEHRAGDLRRAWWRVMWRGKRYG